MRINHFRGASGVIQGKFVVRGYLGKEENRGSNFAVLKRIIQDSINLFNTSTAIEGIGENGEKCDMRGNPASCVVISI